MPYDHYALIYLDADGEIKVDESHSTQEQNSTLFTADARRKFLEKQGLDSAEPMSCMHCIDIGRIDKRLKLQN